MARDKKATAPLDIIADEREKEANITGVPDDADEQDEKNALLELERKSKLVGDDEKEAEEDGLVRMRRALSHASTRTFHCAPARQRLLPSLEVHATFVPRPNTLTQDQPVRLSFHPLTPRILLSHLQQQSEVNRELKRKLDALAKTIIEDDDAAKLATAMDGLRGEIRTSTSSMTSVPMPLKFLRPHYPALTTRFTSMTGSSSVKTQLADILSVLAVTMGAPGARESLTYKLQGTTTELGEWGHEFVRSLSGELGQEFDNRVLNDKDTADLMVLVDDIVPFNMDKNAEVEALDLLIEVDRIDDALQYVTKDQAPRVGLYLHSCSAYVADNDERVKILTAAFTVYEKHELWGDALRIALRMNDREKVSTVIAAAKAGGDELVVKQLGFILALQRVVGEEWEDDEELTEIIGNVNLSEHFANLARELDVQEAKTPEDIYKTHLAEGGKKSSDSATAGVDSAKQNLASTFVNAFVNCGFGKDLLVTVDGSDWLYKNKEHGMISAAASLGMIMLWDVETGFSAIDKYSFSAQNYIKAGSVMATGIISSGVTSEMDAALALLSEHVESDDMHMKLAAVYGLGLAYAGSAREDVLEILVPLIVDDSQTMEVVALTCLSLGLVFCGTGNDDISGSIIEAFLDRSDTDLRDPSARMMCLGLGLLFLGRAEQADTAVETLDVIEHPIKTYLKMCLETCAFAGTGSVMQIQKYLRAVAPATSKEGEGGDNATGDKEKSDDAATAAAAAAAADPAAAAEAEEKSEEAKEAEEAFNSMHHGVAVLGIALTSMGEELSTDMALRMLESLIQLGDLHVKRAVPLALGLLSISNPRLTVMDTLSRLSHDQDLEVSQNAVLALGFLGAGTNHARIADTLRRLAVFYAKEPNHLFLVRIAQGLLHMGKGLMTLNPHHSNNMLMSNVALSGLLAVFHASLDLKSTILGKKHYLLYSLVTAVRPRMLVTLDENLKSIPVKVRVGQAVDTVAQAGKPKTITGFQTHTTPVLLGAGDRAEFSTDKYIALTSVLEGFVIVRLNPDAEDEDEEEKDKK
jgi:26S proteasome regulatory subunit N1